MPVTFSWFKNNNPFNPNSPSSYDIANDKPSCFGNKMVCAIYAQVDANNKPIITQALADEITTALNNHSNSTNVLLRN